MAIENEIMNYVTIASKQPFDFSGDVPRHYDRFSGPMFFEPYAIEASNRINPSSVSVALELASGTGRATRHLRNILPPTSILIASDVSADMLAIAKQKVQATNIDWRMIDAQEIPFDNDSIDLVVCCFGYMFVSDKVKAFREVHRVLRRGGTLLFTTWDKLESIGASQVYRTVAKRYLTDPLPESYNLPFSMHDPVATREMLQQAGFSKISIEKIVKDSVSPSAKEAAEGLTGGGAIYDEIMRRNPTWIPEIKALVEKELAEKFGPSPMIAPMSALISQAWK